jgi:hypothetical protein
MEWSEEVGDQSNFIIEFLWRDQVFLYKLTLGPGTSSIKNVLVHFLYILCNFLF